MHKHIKLLAGAFLAVSITSPAVAQDSAVPTADTVVATVDGVDITVGHMIMARASLPAQYQDLPDQQLYDGILEQLVQQTALSQTLEGDLSKRAALSLENEERALRANEVIQTAMASAVTEADVQAAYDEQFGSFVPETEYNASHILVPSEEEAIAIKEEIDAGADFAETAQEKSTGPSGPNGGNLGWFQSGAMVPEFEAATIALEAGEVSDPVQTQFGWHVIKLNEVGETTVPTLEETRANITQSLQGVAINEMISNSTDSANVTLPDDLVIDASVLRQLELLD